MTTIAQQIRELQRLTPAQLAHRYAELFGRAPRTKNKAWLFRQCAWKVQEREIGGLPERARTRLDELVAQINLPLGTAPLPPRPRVLQRAEAKTPMVGTTLTRKWHDQELRVGVRDDGFEWNGTIYRSLSAVAKAITGAAWNGRLFFGLTSRRSAS